MLQMSRATTKYVDCVLDTNYQHYHNNVDRKHIYDSKTEIFKSDMNLWHKVWKIVAKIIEKYCTFFEKIIYIVIVNLNKGMTI